MIWQLPSNMRSYFGGNIVLVLCQCVHGGVAASYGLSLLSLGPPKTLAPNA